VRVIITAGKVELCKIHAKLTEIFYLFWLLLDHHMAAVVVLQGLTRR
jgi:hypothetical protein